MIDVILTKKKKLVRHSTFRMASVEFSSETIAIVHFRGNRG